MAGIDRRHFMAATAAWPALAAGAPCPDRLTEQAGRLEEPVSTVRFASCMRDELSVVQAALDYLMDDKSTPQDTRNRLAILKAYVRRIDQSAKQVLFVTENRSISWNAVNLEEVLSQLASLLQRLLGEDVVLQMALDADLWPVRGDVTQLENIVLSLVANARDSMPNGGTVRVVARNVPNDQHKTKRVITAGDYVLIEVVDNGVGIPKDIRERIFEPFVSGKGSDGFGLAKVYSAINNLNGQITFKSEPERGTTFSVFLPRLHAGQDS